MKSGNILEHKGGKVLSVSWFLGRLLKLFERKWDGWGWHLSIAWKKTKDGWWILEATSDGVEKNYYDNDYLFHNTRIHSWLDSVPSTKKMKKFYDSHVKKKYDVAIYLWTGMQYIIRHFFNHRIPGLLDDRFTCWELVFEFCEEMGKPLSSKYDCPIITDALNAMEVQNDRD